MNIVRLSELAAQIEKTTHFNDSHYVLDSAPHFNMAYHAFSPIVVAENSCDTPACICGWVNFLWGDEKYLSNEISGAEALGLSDVTAKELFYPDSAGKDYQDITPEEAVMCINILINTGEVRWDEAIEACAEGGEDDI